MFVFCIICGILIVGVLGVLVRMVYIFDKHIILPLLVLNFMLRYTIR